MSQNKSNRSAWRCETCEIVNYALKRADMQPTFLSSFSGRQIPKKLSNQIKDNLIRQFGSEKKVPGLPKGLFIWQTFMLSFRNKLLSPYHSLSMWEAFIIRRSSGRICDSRSMKTSISVCFGISVPFRTSWNNLKQLTTPLAKMRRHKKRWVLPQRHSIIVRV